MKLSSTISSLQFSVTTPSLHFISTPLYLTPNSNTASEKISIIRSPERRRPLTGRVSSSSSENQTVTAELQSTTDSDFAPLSASDVVRNFYEGINGRDLAAVKDLIAADCVYEDLVFPRPFVGRQAIMEFFNEFINTISRDLQFVIDDISTEDSSRVGVIWHLDWKGKPFPFSKGCSFYRLEVVDGQRQIIYGRDCVEPATKPGEAALGIIKAVTWLLEKFPQIADKL